MPEASSITDVTLVVGLSGRFFAPPFSKTLDVGVSLVTDVSLVPDVNLRTDVNLVMGLSGRRYAPQFSKIFYVGVG